MSLYVSLGQSKSPAHNSCCLCDPLTLFVTTALPADLGFRVLICKACCCLCYLFNIGSYMPAKTGGHLFEKCMLTPSIQLHRCLIQIIHRTVTTMFHVIQETFDPIRNHAHGSSIFPMLTFTIFFQNHLHYKMTVAKIS